MITVIKTPPPGHDVHYMIVEYVDARDKRHLYTYTTSNLPVKQLPTLLAEATSAYKVEGHISFYINATPKGVIRDIPNNHDEVPSSTLFRIIIDALSIAVNIDKQ